MKLKKFSEAEINEYLSLPLTELYDKLEELYSPILYNKLEQLDSIDTISPSDLFKIIGLGIGTIFLSGAFSGVTSLSGSPIIRSLIGLLKKTPQKARELKISGETAYLILKNDLQKTICSNEVVLAYINKGNDSKIIIAQSILGILEKYYSSDVSIIFVAIIIREGLKIFCENKNNKSIFVG